MKPFVASNQINDPQCCHSVADLHCGKWGPGFFKKSKMTVCNNKADSFGSVVLILIVFQAVLKE